MIERYQNEAMANIWSEENKYQAWLEVEILATEAWAELGEVPKEDAKALRQNAKINVSRLLEIEQETKHDVVAFTRMLSESLGEERRWVHYGLTSTDVVDTANGYLLKQANDVLRKDFEAILQVAKEKALAYKEVLAMGRTHGVHAEATSFGLKFAAFYDEMRRNQERFEHAAKGVEAGKISGAVGNFANIPPEIEEYVCEHLGITAQPISTQVLPRDLHAEYAAMIALTATSIERMATEIRHLQRTEVHEVEERFRKGQKGSSAMPHKRNPIGSENVSGLARMIRGYMTPAFEDVNLWHERDISHSSVERIMLPDMTTLLDYIMQRFTRILDQLTILPDNIERNLQATHGLIHSQQALLLLIDKGLSRETAYDMIQPKTAIAWEEGKSLKTLIEEDYELMQYVTKEELDHIFDDRQALKRVDVIYQRLGLI